MGPVAFKLCVVSRNALAAFLGVSRNALAAFLGVSRNALAAFLRYRHRSHSSVAVRHDSDGPHVDDVT
jgi:hypothetical protein